MTNPVEGWSNARYWSFIRSGLRRLWTKYPNKYKVLNAAKRRKLHAKGNQKYEYKCSECSNFFFFFYVSVDHITLAGTLRDFSDLPDFCARLFCSIEGLQVLCSKCHQIKTNEERGIIPEISEFKNSKAAEQIAKLAKLNLPEGSNAAKRLSIFTEYYENKVS